MAENPAVVVILITYPADGDAAAFAAALVEEGHAACVNVLPEVDSVYRWAGVVERSSERQLIVKTRTECIEALRRRVRALHPYDTPEFLVLQVADGDARYLAWVKQATGGEAT